MAAEGRATTGNLLQNGRLTMTITAADRMKLTRQTEYYGRLSQHDQTIWLNFAVPQVPQCDGAHVKLILERLIGQENDLTVIPWRRAYRIAEYLGSVTVHKMIAKMINKCQLLNAIVGTVRLFGITNETSQAYLNECRTRFVYIIDDDIREILTKPKGLTYNTLTNYYNFRKREEQRFWHESNKDRRWHFCGRMFDKIDIMAEARGEIQKAPCCYSKCCRNCLEEFLHNSIDCDRENCPGLLECAAQNDRVGVPQQCPTCAATFTNCLTYYRRWLTDVNEMWRLRSLRKVHHHAQYPHPNPGPHTDTETHANLYSEVFYKCYFSGRQDKNLDLICQYGMCPAPKPKDVPEHHADPNYFDNW